MKQEIILFILSLLFIYFSGIGIAWLFIRLHNDCYPEEYVSSNKCYKSWYIIYEFILQAYKKERI